MRRPCPVLGVVTLGALALWVAGCLKSLDESKLDATGGSGAVGGGGTGGNTGGTSASGGASGSGAGGAGGTSPFVPYDPAKFPVTKLADATPPVVLTVDDTHVYHSIQDVADAPLTRTPLSGGASEPLVTTLEKPRALAIATGSDFLLAVGGKNTGGGGSLVRFPKGGGTKEEISVPGENLLAARAIYAATDGFAYVTFDTDASHKVELARFGVTAGIQTATPLSSTTSTDVAGPVVASGDCAYFIADGGVWVVPVGGGNAKNALVVAVHDAVGLSADAVNLYYTRAEGSVWVRTLSGSACDGAGPLEKELSKGFQKLGPIVRFKTAPMLAFAALGDESAANAGGGVFVIAPAGGGVTQIAPGDGGPASLHDAPGAVVYATKSGEIRKVPKP